MNWKALVVAVVMVTSVVGAPATAAATQEASGQAQTGTYVSFETADSAVVDYTVNGNTLVDRMSVQSTSEAKSQSGGGLGLGGAVFAGAGLNVASTFGAGVSTTATIEASSGAEMTVHDNDRGITVVRANGESHVARYECADSADARKESEKRAVIQGENGATGVVIVVGEGNVSVSESGNVTAQTDGDGRIVYRQYDGERSQSEKNQEQLIADGTTVAEVYLQGAAESGEDSSDEGQERTADVVRYSEDTTVEVTETSKNRLNATVERAQSQGKVVIVTLSEAAFQGAQNAQVYVDGEAAAKASSYSALKAATDGGETSKYLVRSSTSAQASSDVVVGINHFSAREVSVQSADGGDGGEGDGSTGSGGQPGFGVGVAVVALAGAALLARRQR